MLTSSLRWSDIVDGEHRAIYFPGSPWDPLQCARHALSVWYYCSIFKDIIFIPVLVLINEFHVVWHQHRDFSRGEGYDLYPWLKWGLFCVEKRKNPLLTLVITDYFLQIKCYLTSFSFVLILINVFIIFLLNTEEKLAVPPFIAIANPH